MDPSHLVPTNLDLSSLALAALLSGLLLAWLALRRLRRRSLATGGLAGLLALLLIVSGGLLVGLAISFQAIDTLTEETGIGSLTFRQLGPDLFEARAEFTQFDTPQDFVLAGQQWQLDVRFLRWRTPVMLLGIDGLYQLDRLSGRYAELDGSDSMRNSAFSLAGQPGQTLWDLALLSRPWVASWIDMDYGSSIYLPMADGARYRILITPFGVLARADNDVARRATENW
ncbi:MAG: hypothetical protein WBO47_05775 [Gammaproteobacteria bacterium]